MASAQTPTLWGVLSETNRIISANSWHFLAISSLFLLPLTLSFVFYPLLFQPTSIPPNLHRSLLFYFTPDPDLPPVDKSQLIIPLLYALFVLLFSLFATASITHSTFHGFHSRPVKFVSSVKSILFSFLPLLATLIVTGILVGLVFFAFGCFSVILYNGITMLGVDIDYGSSYFLIFLILTVALLVIVLTYLRVKWYLANAIVVVESQWGFAPLKRSSYLVKGVKRVVFGLMLLFGILFGLLSLSTPSLVPNAGEDSRKQTDWNTVLGAVGHACLLMIVMLYCVVANTVLFMYCKAFHGEIAMETADDYISLPLDEEKVPGVINFV